LSSPFGTTTLKRQCIGKVEFNPLSLTNATYLGDVFDLAQVVGMGNPWPHYSWSGYSPTFTIDSNHYIALRFTPQQPGAIQLTANGSYGDGGTISVSTVPGAFTMGDPNVVCMLSRGGANGIYITTDTNGAVCPVQVGTTYYLNFADENEMGNALCYNDMPNSCTSSLVAYTIYTQ
jgi:hypothetical protein